MLSKYLFEMKYRMLFCLIAWIFIMINCYYFKEILLYVFIKPSFKLHSDTALKFMTTNVTEVFFTYLNLSHFVANQFLILYTFFQIFLQIANGLYKFEYIYFKTILTKWILLWFFCIFFLNKFLFPIVWFFFFKFQNSSFNFEIKLYEYIDFYHSIYFTCDWVFKIIILLLILLDLVKLNLFLIKKFKKICYFFFAILATFVTPPDVIQQLITGIFIIVIYELIIFNVIFKYELANN
mgnify:CR=1 FL=1